MKKILFLLLLLSYTSTAQWTGKGEIMTEVGALPPFAINFKSGYTIRNNIVAGVFTEHHSLFSRRNEIGVFGRKYMLDKKGMTIYLHGAVAGGRYRTVLWGFDKFHREQSRTENPFTTIKFIGGGGISYKITKKMSLGHEATLGSALYKNKSFPSFLFTFNYRFGSNP